MEQQTNSVNRGGRPRGSIDRRKLAATAVRDLIEQVKTAIARDDKESALQLCDVSKDLLL